MDIKSINAVVTGGASGLGEASARDLAGRGAKVALIDMNAARGRDLADDLGDGAYFLEADVADENAMDDAVRRILDRLGAIHVVVNCAGVGGSVKIVGREGVMPLERFRQTVNVNLIGTFNVIRATAEAVMSNYPDENGERGVYINTASIAAFDGQVGQAAYSASKGGIVSMTLTLAREFANQGIRVMSILPGIMDTPLLARNTEKVLERLARQVPFPARLGYASEFAALASHIIENPYLNGEAVRLDGALRMGFGRK